MGLGWCLDGHHSSCPGRFYSTLTKVNLICGCKDEDCDCRSRL